MYKYILTLGLLLWTTLAGFAITRYVKPAATGTGLSWANASGDLQSMMNASSVGDEVWIAAGTYTPNSFPTGCLGCGSASSNNRNNTFFVKFGVTLVGGFAGTETSKTERNVNANETILSGDFGADGNISNNAYHVVTLVNCNNNNTTLEKLTIKHGNANGVGLTITVSGQTYYQEWGGGILMVNSNNSIKQCSIVENYAISGGGILNTAFSSPKINNSIFALNNAQGGGAIYNHNSSPAEFRQSTIASNTATVAGGAMYNLDSNPIIVNSVIWSNNSPAFPSIANNSSTPSVTRSVVDYGFSPCIDCPNTDGNNNPLFENQSVPSGQDNKWGTHDDGLRLSDCSIGIDYAETCFNTDLDITNRPRAFDVPFRDNRLSSDIGECSFDLDLGAYESQSINRKIIYVNNGLATGANDGTTWTNAFRTNTALQEALNTSCLSNEIWVAAGTYKPSNIPIECIGCSGSRDYSFFIRENIRLIGGFTGNETSIAQSDPIKNPTILSGDVGTPLVNTDNCHNVVTMVDNPSESAIFGFKITNANINGSGTFIIRSRTLNRTQGGGMLIVGSAETYIEKCTIENNIGNGLVGIFLPEIRVINSTINHNNGTGLNLINSAAEILGNSLYQNTNAAISITNGESNIAANAIVGNTSFTFSAGINIIGGNHAVYNNLISGNSAALVAGGVGLEGGFCNLLNNTITNNSGTLQGGGLYVNDTDLNMVNNIFWKNNINGNQSAIGSDVFRNSFLPGLIMAQKCMFQMAESSSQYADIVGIDNIFAINPLFINENDADGPDNILRTPDDGFSLKNNSPAINTGAPVGIDFDILLRIGYTNPTPQDIGAYQFVPKADCISNRHIGDNPIENGVHFSGGKITTNGKVGNSSNVEMNSSNSIELLPGFETMNNSIFRAIIEGCGYIMFE
jgi:hypothetical protein